MPAHQMNAAEAGRIAWRVRKLHRRGDLTHADLAIADALIWAARTPGTACATVSYSGLCRLAHVARSTVAASLKRLEGLGVIKRIKRRVLVGWASRQAVSLYVLCLAATESDHRPVIQSLKNLTFVQVPAKAVKQAQEALRRVRERRAGVLACRGLGMRQVGRDLRHLAADLA